MMMTENGLKKFYRVPVCNLGVSYYILRYLERLSGAREMHAFFLAAVLTSFM